MGSNCSIHAEINYTGSCVIRKWKAVHIVLQTKTGPVTILLMPGEFINDRHLVFDGLFSGSVVAIENGSFAIITEFPQSFKELEQRFKSSLSFI